MEAQHGSRPDMMCVCVCVLNPWFWILFLTTYIYKLIGTFPAGLTRPRCSSGWGEEGVRGVLSLIISIMQLKFKKKKEKKSTALLDPSLVSAKTPLISECDWFKAPRRSGSSSSASSQMGRIKCKPSTKPTRCSAAVVIFGDPVKAKIVLCGQNSIRKWLLRTVFRTRFCWKCCRLGRVPRKY